MIKTIEISASQDTKTYGATKDSHGFEITATQFPDKDLNCGGLKYSIHQGPEDQWTNRCSTQLRVSGRPSAEGQRVAVGVITKDKVEIFVATLDQFIGGRGPRVNGYLDRIAVLEDNQTARIVVATRCLPEDCPLLSAISTN